MRVESLTMSNVLLFAFLNVRPDKSFNISALTWFSFQVFNDVLIILFRQDDGYSSSIFLRVLLYIFQLIKVSGFLPAQSVYNLLSSVTLSHSNYYVNDFFPCVLKLPDLQPGKVVERLRCIVFLFDQKQSDSRRKEKS